MAYYGTEVMKGERGRDIRNLAKAMKKKKKAFQEGHAERGKWRGISNVLETAAGFIPGVGKFVKPILDVLSEQVIQKFIDVEGGPDLVESETMWTGGEATAAQEEWEKLYGASDETLLEGLIRGGGSFMKSEAGGKFMEKLFGGTDLPTMEKIDVADVTGEFADISEAPLGRLARESMDLSISPEMLENLPSPLETSFRKEVLDMIPQTVDVPKMSRSLEQHGMTWLQNLLEAPQELRTDENTEELYWGAKQYQQGGQVPEYYGGGNVAGGGTTPTIANYFSMQGKTLGGSNKQSVSEILGRR
jgi:hypothetical protein